MLLNFITHHVHFLSIVLQVDADIIVITWHYVIRIYWEQFPLIYQKKQS